MSFDFQVVPDQNLSGRNVANPTVIKVIGCGGGGSSGVRRMIESNVEGVEFVVMNTDLQALSKNPAPTKLAIGQKLTGGLGSGGNPEVGENAAREDTSAIEGVVAGADMIILTAGMGGGTGTGSIPVVAEIARKAGALTVAVVTTPFDFEGSDRMNNARTGIDKLRECVDALIEIPNESVFKIIDKNITFVQAFQLADELLSQGVKGITEIITKEGIVNRDFNDVKTVLKEAGNTLLGVGEGSGENRAIDAAQMAISNPMLENMKMDGATKILVNITAPADITMDEVREINSTITASCAAKHHLLWGQIVDPSMDGKVRVIVIATGFKKLEAVPVSPVIAEPEIKNPNVISADDFSDLLNPSYSEPETKAPVVDAEKEEEEKAKPIFSDDALGGSFDKVKPSYTNTVNPPAGFNGQNDINQPACWRQSNYSKTIRFDD